MKIKIFILIPFLFLLTGCFDYNELNKLALVTGISIDKNGDLYQVGIFVADSKKDKDNLNNIFKGSGKTLSEAFNEIELTSPKKLYLGHLNVVIISDSIAKEGLTEITDFLIREPESAKRFYMVLARNFKALDGLENISSNLNKEHQSVYQNIKINSVEKNEFLNITFIDFVETLITDGIDGIIPSVIISKNEIKTDKIGLFKGDKLIGYANNNSTLGIRLLKNSLDDAIIKFNYNEGYVVVNMNNISTKVDANKNGALIKINGSANIKEANCYMDINDNSAIKNLEKKLEKEIIKKVNIAYNESKKYKTDIFGYGNLIYKRNPKYFNKIKSKWDDKYYPNLNANIKVDIKLSNESSIIRTIKEAKDEK